MTGIRARSFHPWHDVPTGPSPRDIVTCVIEIPANERNKYELDKELGVFRLDRVLYEGVHTRSKGFEGAAAAARAVLEAMEIYQEKLAGSVPRGVLSTST